MEEAPGGTNTGGMEEWRNGGMEAILTFHTRGTVSQDTGHLVRGVITIRGNCVFIAIENMIRV